jgi:alpha-maltose-1-phosphate synthase
MANPARQSEIAINFVGAATAPGGEVRGIDVAVETMLSALFKYGTQSNYPVYIEGPTATGWDSLQKLSAESSRSELKAVQEGDLNGLTLFRQDPDLSELAWRRQQFGARAHSLCGLVHTMAGSQTMALVRDCMTAPGQKWDAIICPSNAIRDVVAGLWSSWGEYLGARTGAAFDCPIQLPVIPLGIDVDRFQTDDTRRNGQRRALGVAEDAIVILCHGRMSFAFKQHPAPVLLAAQQTALAVDHPVHLVFSGYFHPESFEVDFRETAAAVCQNATVTFVGNDDPEFPDGLWAGADFFVSLSDNIQESFGLTPIEAMAAGLPVVISDWDGYRDAVEHGVQGFKVPTVMAPAGDGAALADRYAGGIDVYGEYLAGASLSTSVDVAATTEAFITLSGNKELRRRMGAAGRARTRDIYDWRRIIPRYEALWDELTAIRIAESAAPATDGARNPAFPDPFDLYKGFATTSLQNDDCLKLSLPLEQLNIIFAQRMNMFRADLLLPPTDLLRLAHLSRREGGLEVATAVAEFQDPPRVRLSLVWLLKMGVCALGARS